MGVQEALWGVGVLVLLGALANAAVRAGRVRREPAAQVQADPATRRNFDVQ